jgi:NAD dependent epimerase/dehydratase family enzyme
MHVFVTGGTGMLGTPLVHKLLARGYRVDLLTRRYARARQEFGTDVTPHEGDPMQAGSWMEAAAAADGVINLYGENIFNRRWHPAFKQLLRDSRVQSTTNVAAALASKPRRLDGSPKVLVNASAIGF